jgi:hypothetical protein
LLAVRFPTPSRGSPSLNIHETNKYLADWLDRPFSELTGENLIELHQ